MVRRKSSSELELAEIKFQTLRERRDAFNSEAIASRDERNLLHAETKNLAGKLRVLRAQRQDALAEMRAHRDARNRLQAEARELIELKRKFRGRIRTSVAGELERLRTRVRELETRQQTSALSLQKENELLDDIKSTFRSIQELEALKAEQDGVSKDVRELDAAIDDRFREAEEEHKHVVAFGSKADALRTGMEALMPQMKTISAEADKKHEHFVALRAKADEVHAKMLEMREKIITIRGDRRAEAREAREAIRTQSLQVRQKLDDRRKLDEAAERAVETLLRGGRVEIKG